jgi:hypothetical protein
VKAEVEKFETHINVGVDEMANLVDELRSGSGKPAILITVDEMSDSLKINMRSFNMASLGVMLTLVEAVKMIAEDLKEDMHEGPGTLQ